MHSPCQEPLSRLDASGRAGKDLVLADRDFSLTFRLGRLDSAEVTRLIADYEDELVRYGIVLDHGEAGSVSAEEMTRPHGSFLVVELDGAAVACGGVRRLGDDVAEVKRMYVAPTARRVGVARALLARLEDEARALGCRVARLDTGRDMTPALTLYRSAGYVEIPDYNGNPHAAYWMEKVL